MVWYLIAFVISCAGLAGVILVNRRWKAGRAEQERRIERNLEQIRKQYVRTTEK